MSVIADLVGRFADLLAAPLAGRWHDVFAHGGVLGERGLVYVALFVIVAAVVTYNYRRTRGQMAAMAVDPAASGMPAAPGMAAGMAGMAKVLPLMSFATLVTVAVVPLAAALYVVTSTTWSAVERAVLYRDMPGAAGAAGATPVLA